MKLSEQTFKSSTIIGDKLEEERTHAYFKDVFKEDYSIELLGVRDCKENKVPIYTKSGKTICISEDEADIILINSGVLENGRCMENCKYKSFIQVADFKGSLDNWAAERKRVDDMYHSMLDGRIYQQLDKLDAFYGGNKFLILEGDPSMKFFEDSVSKNSPFRNIPNTKSQEFRNKSPMEQLIEISGDRADWCWSIVKECVQRNINFIQTKDLNETIKFIEQINKGAGTGPKLRIIPKRLKTATNEQNMLMGIKGVGIKTTDALLKKFGSLSSVIKHLQSIDEETAKKSNILYKIWKVIVNECNS